MTNLRELRTLVAANKECKNDFDNELKQQDASEWIMILYQTIASMLDGDIKDQFIDMIRVETRITDECCLFHHQKQMIVNTYILELSVVDPETGHPINNLSQILQKYFDEEQIERSCPILPCISDLSMRKECITVFPQVLILQYNRFTAQSGKLDHSITADTTLQLENIEYELTGFVVHMGTTIRSGHYFAITRCWETGNGYLLDDNSHPQPILDCQLLNFIQQAYILVFCRKSDQTEALVNPTICNQEQSHGNNEATKKPMDEEDAAGGAPTEARRVGDQFTSQEAPLHEDEQNILHMLQERNYICDIPVKNRTKNQRKEYRILQTHLKGLNA